MSLLIYDIHNNLARDNIKNMLKNLTTVYSYRTRSVTNENYYVDNNNKYNKLIYIALNRIVLHSALQYYNDIRK